MVQIEIGSYGRKWMAFMERCHPELVKWLQNLGTFEEVAQSVDNDAWEYRELLDRQYAELHPRPQNSFEKIAAWERTRAFYTDGVVMREWILIPYTKA